MTVTKIKLNTFSRIVKEARDNYQADCEMFPDGRMGTYRDYLRDELEEQRHLFDLSDGWKNQAAPEPADFDEIHEALTNAAHARMQYGATPAQIELLAKLAFQNEWTARDLDIPTLTKADASLLIDDLAAKQK